MNIFLASLLSGTSSSFVTNAFLVYIVNLLTFTEFFLLSILSLPNVDVTSHLGLTYRLDPNFPSIITYFFFPGHFFLSSIFELSFRLISKFPGSKTVIHVSA